jgi:hypothetical protein
MGARAGRKTMLTSQMRTTTAGDWRALSVKQPWAALIVAGVKTVEVRTWPTRRRGPFLVHASKVPDPRPEAWALVEADPVLRVAADMLGGFVGVATLVECVDYPTAAKFAADTGRHRVPAEWYRAGLVGFVLAGARPVPFREWAGNTSFFGVDGYEPEEPIPR